MKILLDVAFLGTAYCGYQKQKGVPSIQETLTDAALCVFGEPCDITGCSRTDSGVHANQFCVTVSSHNKSGIDTTIPIDKIPIAFANTLPKDIAVKGARWVEESFHPRYDVKYKEYEYRIYNGKYPDPFIADRSWHYPRAIDNQALTRMNEAAGYFVGRNDFAAYMAAGSDIKDTHREVFEAKVFREGDTVVFRVSADGFLYNMVRIFTGTLIAVAEGRIAPEEIPEITESLDRKRAGITAPAHGLYLNRVVYN